jgi:hypothetical protein
MSNAKPTNQTKALTVANFAPLVEVADNAPKPKVDFYNPHLSFEDVLPENFFSMDSLQARLDARGGAESLILTIAKVSMELLFDASKGETAKDGEWKPVVWFEETETGLVINKTRGQQLTRLAGSPLLAAWERIGRVAIKPGIGNGKAQIVIGPVPGEGGGNALKNAVPLFEDEPNF